MHTVQATLDDLGTSLADVTFVVVDLETTGGSPADCAITEIGAVKVRGGEVLGEFHTLINPERSIPPFIQVLTGISDHMVAESPLIDSVLPAFLEFAHDCVLVAHNAGFDIGFLKASAQRLNTPWPQATVLDTVTLARKVLHRDETPNCKLASLAMFFGAQTQPDHRALHDARATVDVLHGLLARVGNIGVRTLEELTSYTARVTAQQRAKRVLADGLPGGPGCYVFKDANGRALYVGTSKNIRHRVRSYFTASETRSRMAHMVALATTVDPIPCQSALEARVRELRLIADNQPRFNRRSRRPDRLTWVKLTDEPFPRLSIVRQVRDDDATYIGPFTSARIAAQAVEALHEAVPLRRCTDRLPLKPKGKGCALGEMGHCGSPCTGAQSHQEYGHLVDELRQALHGDVLGVLAPGRQRLADLTRSQRYEDAAVERDRLRALLHGVARTQRFRPLAGIPELVAARRQESGGWEIACLRYGRFAGTTLSPRGADPMPYVHTLQATAEVVPAPIDPALSASVEEVDLLLKWLDEPGVRIVHLDGQWVSPVHGAEQLLAQDPTWLLTQEARLTA